MDERPWLFRQRENSVEVADDALGLLGGAQVGIREHECSDSVRNEGIKLCRSVANLGVLHQDGPAALTGIPQPLLVVQSLTDAFSVDIRHGVHRDAGLAKRCRHGVTFETSVDENSGGTPKRDTQDVPDACKWHAEVVCDLYRAVAGLEAID